MSFEIPVTAYPRCLVCDKPVTETRRVLNEVYGYTEPRGQGGPNHIIRRQETGRIVGPCCIERVKAGIDVRQDTLL